MTLPQQPIQQVTCEGTPFEMGLIQGQTFREQIQRSSTTIAELEAVRLSKPPLIPYPMFLRLAERQAMRFLQRAFTTIPLSARERLEGIATGAKIPLRKLALCSALEAVLSNLTKVTSPAAIGACSSFAATGSATSTGAPFLAHNFDYLPVIQPYYLIRRSHPRDGFRSVELGVMPIPGAVTGINEAGLAITCNYAYAVDKPAGDAPTITMLIAEALAHHRSVESAVTYFRNTPRVGGGNLLLGDATGKIAALEIANTRVELCEPDRDLIFRTNRYHHPEMIPLELEGSATYNASSPRALRGIRVHQSAETREAHFHRLLSQRSAFDADSVQEVMSDHGPEQFPTNTTICVHSDYWHTTASLQLFPQSRLLRASFSPTCAAEYQEFKP